jgi:hypothetical protein
MRGWADSGSPKSGRHGVVAARAVADAASAAKATTSTRGERLHLFLVLA